MTKQEQMTEQELDQISGGPHYSDFNGRPGVMLCGGTCPDAIRRKQGTGSRYQTDTCHMV